MPCMGESSNFILFNVYTVPVILRDSFTYCSGQFVPISFCFECLTLLSTRLNFYYGY
jgi:hypothetical protein